MARLRKSTSRHKNFAHKEQRRNDDDNLETLVGKYIKVQPDGCWQYTGTLSEGYGMHGKVGLVHRFVYETLVGEIPDGHHLHHECENRACANPKHLIPLTPAEHMRIHHIRKKIHATSDLEA